MESRGLAPWPVEIVDNPALRSMSDDELWRRAMTLAAHERGATVDLVEHLAELDSRRLWFQHEFNGMFEYCVCCLRLSEDAAYKRIRAARAVRLFPPIVILMRSGLLSLAAVVRLHPYLDRPDAASFVKMGAGLRIRNLEKMLAVHQPSARKEKDVVRYLAPASRESPTVQSTAPLAMVETKSAEAADPTVPASIPSLCLRNEASARITFTADADFLKMMEQARSLLRHKYPDGRLEGVLRDALRALLERRDPVIRWESKKGRRRRAAMASARGSGGAPRPGRGA